MPNLVLGSPEYKVLHKTLQLKRGKASSWSCINCSNSAWDWAHVHNTDPFDIVNYFPMCRSCHCTYDNKRFGADRYCAKLTEAQVIEIRELQGQFTQRQLAIMFGVGKTAIADIHNYKKWTHI